LSSRWLDSSADGSIEAGWRLLGSMEIVSATCRAVPAAPFSVMRWRLYQRTMSLPFALQ
jgi:hypothetical protein